MTSRFRFTPPRTTQRPLLPPSAGAGICVAVEGPIGVGKTTLTHLLAPRMEADEVLEVVEENPFLHYFYDDIRGYAFQTQIFFSSAAIASRGRSGSRGSRDGRW